MLNASHHAEMLKQKEKALLLETKEKSILETREKALKWLWIGFWGKWIFTTILGIFFLLALTPCLKLFSKSDKNLWSEIITQGLLSVFVFSLAFWIFLYLLKRIRQGLLWPLYIMGMYEVVLIFLLGMETMGYTANPQHGIDALEMLSHHSCSLIPKLQTLFRFSVAMIMAFVCLGAYACFTLYKNPLEGPPPESA